MSDTVRGAEVRLEIRINASAETVFALLTDPVRMRTWLAELVEAISARRDIPHFGTFRSVHPRNLSGNHSKQEGGVHLGRRGRSRARAIDRGVRARARRRGHIGAAAPLRTAKASSPRLALFRNSSNSRIRADADRAVSERDCPATRGRLTRGPDHELMDGCRRLMASICTVGHAIAGRKMFYRPIKSAITDELHAGVSCLPRAGAETWLRGSLPRNLPG